MTFKKLRASSTHDPGKRDLKRICNFLQAHAVLLTDGDRSSDDRFFSLAFGHSCTVLNSGAVYFMIETESRPLH